MNRNFQYLIYGSGLTLLVLAAVFSFVLSNAQANEVIPQNRVDQITDHNHLEITPLQTIEEDPIPNTSNNHQEQLVSELDKSKLASPTIAISEDDVKQEDGGETVYAHTLNGTLVATSRGIIALLENNQEKDGSVKIPKVLQKWMGKERIDKNG